MKIKISCRPQQSLWLNKKIIGLALNVIFIFNSVLSISNKIYISNATFNSSLDTPVWKTEFSDMITPTGYLTSNVVNNKIYCIGGIGDNSSRLKTVQIYDPETDTWTKGADMPTSRGYLTSAVLGSKIYCIGGFDGSNFTNKVEIYDTKTNKWSTGASISSIKEGMTAEAVDGKIYVIGGCYNIDDINTVEIFNPATNKWTKGANMPTARGYLSSTVVGSKIYCVGGGRSGLEKNNLEIYDTKTNTWSIGESLSIPRRAMSLEYYNGKLYAMGGLTTNSETVKEIEVYDILTNTWTNEGEMLIPKDRMVSEIVNEVIYIIGGYTGDRTKTGTIEAYILDNIQIYEAKNAVLKSEKLKTLDSVEYARDLVNKLPEGDLKEELQNRLNAIMPILTLDTKSATANLDIYIKSENMLSLSLDTNSVTFEDYSGVEDVEQLNAVNLTISSSLPYDINAYLETEIQNIDKSKTIDNEVLNIRATGESNYNSFSDIDAPIILLENQSNGNDILHGIDIMLKGDSAYQKDIYKTTIKFEAVQK